MEEESHLGDCSTSDALALFGWLPDNERELHERVALAVRASAASNSAGDRGLEASCRPPPALGAYALQPACEPAQLGPESAATELLVHGTLPWTSLT